MAKFVQLTLDWTQTRKLPDAPQRSAEATELQEATLPGLDASRSPVQKLRRSTGLPVPKPLASAVGKGNFGEDDHGPVRPSAAEVRAITEYHAEKLVELLGRLQEIEGQLARNGTNDRYSLIREKEKFLCEFQGGIALYAEDFGQHAANRLDAYVRHQLRRH